MKSYASVCSVEGCVVERVVVAIHIREYPSGRVCNTGVGKIVTTRVLEVQSYGVIDKCLVKNSIIRRVINEKSNTIIIISNIAQSRLCSV